MENGILFTVIIPCYNAQGIIAEAIQSIPCDDEGIEVIVIDDGSSDQSEEVVKRISVNYKNFIYIKQENQGAGLSRRKGVSTAQGKYLLFLDSDDYYMPHAFLKLKKW